MKHVGKMKNNGAKVVVVYRTLPGDPYSALVVGTNVLGEAYHNSLMNLVEDVSAQQANELADILHVRKFPDGSNMLAWLHTRGYLKKVPTNGVLLTPNTQTTIQLDELNKLIAEQRGISLEELAGGLQDNKVETQEIASIREEQPDVSTNSKPIDVNVDSQPEIVSAESMLKLADQLVEKANAMLKEADLLVQKANTVTVSKKKKKVSA